jgi:hypothetical protein
MYQTVSSKLLAEISCNFLLIGLFSFNPDCDF